MLRITVIDSGQITTFLLEGRLTGDWVQELERCWISTKIIDPKRKFKIDMSDVEFVDAMGEVLLQRMMEEGAEFEAVNPLMKSIIASVAERAKAEHVNH